MEKSSEALLSCAALPRSHAMDIYRATLETNDQAAQQWLCQNDLFYLLTIACKRRDVDRDWLYARCREVEAEPDGYLDLWAREHYKSTIITFAKSIQDLLIDPETTIGIFSHTRPIAKGFLKQIKRELEDNAYLKTLFPEVLYQKPETESPQWSEDSGIIVRRTSNPKDASVEAWGLVDGQPTSKHFKKLVYDDVVTLESVSTPDQIAKTTHAWSTSFNLGAEGGSKRGIGTRYHLNDSYREMMSRGAFTPRIKPATHDGSNEGDPVFLAPDRLAAKRREQGPYVFGCQMLQNPVADRAMNFKPEWLKYYDQLGDTSKWNKYIVVDPASAKKKTSDYTVMLVIGLAPDQNYYLLAGFRDRLNLTQRASRLFELHLEHQPKKVGYERYGMQADTEHVQYEMEQRNYRFDITDLGGSMPKADRIKQLVPIFEQKRFWLPKRLPFVDCEGVTRDFVEIFLRNEYLAFPVTIHDDMLDDMARVLDPILGAEFPKVEKPKPKDSRYMNYGGSQGWMG